MNKETALKNIKANFRGPIDVTYREGEQFAGNYVGDEGCFKPFEISIPQATRILTHLNDIGIEYAEVPNGLVRGIDDYIKNLVAIPDRPKLLSHIRNNVKDVTAAVELGVDGVNILTNVDPERIKAAGYPSMDEYMNTLQQVIQIAKNGGLQTRVSVEHSWNGFFDQALKVFEFADNLGVDRIGLADTLGIANRFDVEDRVGQARQRVRRSDIEVHFHNDGSQGVSNAIEALIHGANYVDTTLAGIGERTGITSLSGLFSALLMLDPGLVKKFNLEFLTSAERYMMEIIGLPVPHNLISSPNAFSHKAGIHTNGIATHSQGLALYQPFPADTVGNTTHVITGTRISGKTTCEKIRAIIPGISVQ